jgi:hypothetical protein
MSNEVDKTEELRRLLVRGLCEQVGLTETAAMQFANPLVHFLQKELAGERLYIPMPPRQYDVLQIGAALDRGDSIDSVCRQFSIGRATLYRLLPNGLTPQKRAG